MKCRRIILDIECDDPSEAFDTIAVLANRWTSNWSLSSALVPDDGLLQVVSFT